MMGIRAVAHELDVFAEALGEAMAKARFQLVPDPFNLSNDARKVTELQARHETSGIQLVKEPSDDSDSDTSAN